MTKRSWGWNPRTVFLDGCIIEITEITNRILSLLQDGQIRHVSSNIWLQNELPFPMISCFASYDIKLF